MGIPKPLPFPLISNRMITWLPGAPPELPCGGRGGEKERLCSSVFHLGMGQVSRTTTGGITSFDLFFRRNYRGLCTRVLSRFPAG
jgi:hypothetical protein